MIERLQRAYLQPFTRLNEEMAAVVFSIASIAGVIGASRGQELAESHPVLGVAAMLGDLAVSSAIAIPAYVQARHEEQIRLEQANK